MRALTLIQPWAWCITHSDKRVENRTWAPPDSLLGQRFAIHAGVSHSGAEIVDALAAQGIPVTGPVHFGAVVGTAVLAAVAVELRGKDWSVIRCGDHSVRRAEELLMSRRGAWAIGPIGWVLDDVRALAEPVPCRGAQGLWTLPSDVETRVRAQESAS